jgi:hypothetical protein
MTKKVADKLRARVSAMGKVGGKRRLETMTKAKRVHMGTWRDSKAGHQFGSTTTRCARCERKVEISRDSRADDDLYP